MGRIFPDKPIFFLLGLVPERRIRQFCAQRMPISTAFSWKQDLSLSKRRLVILPHSLQNLSSALPLLLQLHQCKEALQFLCPREFESLIKAMGLDSRCIYYSPVDLTFFHPEFSKLQSIIAQFGPDLVLNLENNPHLPLHYLIGKSNAAWRVGGNCQSYHPFLNISIELGQASFSVLLEKLRVLFHFGFSKLDHPLKHSKETLSSSQVILLNLEDAIDGTSWSEAELLQLVKQLDPHFRLLALKLDSQNALKYQAILDRLSIRTAPTATSFVVFLEMLKQYRGMISLHSAHAELAIQLSQLPMVILHSPSDTAWMQEGMDFVHAFPKSNPLPSGLLAPLLKP